MKYFIKDDYTEKEVSKKHYERIKKMNFAIQMFFLNCNDFELNKRYPVLDFDLKLKGIDILSIMNLIYKDREDATRNLTLRHSFYLNNQGSIVGWLGTNGFNKLTE